MKQNVNFSEFVDQFNGHGRGDQFSYAGKRALFDYLEEIEAGSDSEYNLDVIALCCDYCEYTSLQEWAADYFGRQDYAEAEGWDLDDERDEQITDYIRDRGELIEFEGGVIVSSF